MLEDSLNFQLSSLAPLQGKKIETLDPRRKEQSAKCQSMTLLVLIFKSSMHIKEIIKTKIQKQKLGSLFIYSSFTLISTLIFHFHQLHCKNKKFVTNNNHI